MQKEKVLITLIRVSIGLIFLWAFLDKLFGLGFSTATEAAWLAGGSPTAGYLLYATHGPFVGVFHWLAQYAWVVDWIFMAGLLGIGVGLTFGVARRVAAYAGIAMLVLMYISAFPPEHHPFLDEHVVYALTLLLIAYRAPKRWI